MTAAHLTDPNRLPVLAAQINRAHDLACRSAQAAISHAIAVGEGLIEAKALLGHGEWLSWLAENCDFSERTAQNYVRLAQHRDEVEANTQRVADLPIREALKAIRRAKPIEPNIDPAFDVPLVPVQDEWKPQQKETRAGLPSLVVARDAVKAAAMPARKEEPIDAEALFAELDELREYAAALEKDIAALKAENKAFEGMRLQWERGGFEQIIADKDEQIRVLNRRLESESHEKVRNLNDMERWKKRAIKLGYSRDVVIPFDEGAA